MTCTPVSAAFAFTYPAAAHPERGQLLAENVEIRGLLATGQHRIRTCDLYGVKPAHCVRWNGEKVLPNREKQRMAL
jgi:hypothetical protein